MKKNLPTNQILCANSKEALKKFPDDCINLVITSPPYADSRKSTYGGINPDNYVEWILPITILFMPNKFFSP